MNKVNAIFITSDALRAGAQVELIDGAYPKEIRRLTGATAYRPYRYVGKSGASELHIYEEITSQHPEPPKAERNALLP